MKDQGPPFHTENPCPIRVAIICSSSLFRTVVRPCRAQAWGDLCQCTGKAAVNATSIDTRMWREANCRPRIRGKETTTGKLQFVNVPVDSTGWYGYEASRHRDKLAVHMYYFVPERPRPTGVPSTRSWRLRQHPAKYHVQRNRYAQQDQRVFRPQA